MTLFFILLIALVVYQYTTRKKMAQIYRQFDKKQIKRLSNAPFYLTSWALLFIFVAYALSALTGMIGELFNVDNYISLFGGGWLGLILQFLRSSGFIGDIQEPIVLMQYRGTISTICSVLLFSGIICIFSLIAYFKELKKPRLNKAAILTYYYLSMACGLTSYILIIWGLYGFNDLMNHGVKFHMEEIYIYLSLFFVASCGFTLIKGAIELKKVFDLPQCENLTWQQLLAKIKINTDKGKRPITEGQIVGIALGLSIFVSSCVILSTLPLSEEQELEQYEPMNTEEEDAIASTSVNTDSVPAPNDDETCMAILQKYYTASFDQIEEWGGFEIFETKRFMHYTSCWDCLVLTSNQDFGIGDECMRLERIEPNENLDHSYIVTVSCGYSGDVPTCVVMTNDEGTWKIDNISYQPYTKAYIDYSKPASDYYVYEDCVEDTTEEQEKLEENYEENENFISL